MISPEQLEKMKNAFNSLSGRLAIQKKLAEIALERLAEEERKRDELEAACTALTTAIRWAGEAGKRIPAEKESGKWVRIHYDNAACSVCGGQYAAPFDTTDEACHRWDELPPFCPQCGAKMERKKLLEEWAAIERKQKRERRASQRRAAAKGEVK